MKTFIGAIALFLAVPAIAQAAPTADPHAGHAQQQPATPGQQKAGHDCKACCEKMKQHGGKMECMDKKGEAKAAAPEADAHQGHAH